jgi:hypothetical protein
MNGDSGTCDDSLARTVNRVASDSKHESLPCKKRIKQATAGARLTTADKFVIEARRIRENWAATNRMRMARRALSCPASACAIPEIAVELFEAPLTELIAGLHAERLTPRSSL